MGDDGLYKRGKIWWIRTDPITGKEKTTKCRDKTAALAFRRERERRAADPTYAAQAAPAKNIGEWVSLVVGQKRRMRAAATADFYESKLGHVVRIFGAASPITHLTPGRFDEYVKQRADEGARPTTILKEIGCAKVVAGEAERHGAFRGNTKLFKPSDLSDDYEPGERFLLPEELAKLLPELSDKRGAHVATAIAIGSRFSESFRIKREDVKHSPATESSAESFLVYVAGTKTKKSKDTIPVAQPFHGLLRAALRFLPLAPWSNMTRDLEAACRRAGIPKVTSNDLRRTNASWLIEAGVPDSMVSRLLRHVDERMVRRVYGRSRPEKLAEAIAGQIANATKARQLPDSGARKAEIAPEKPEETAPDDEPTRGLKILVSAVQFRPGTPGKNTRNGEIAGGSAIGAECQSLSGSVASSQSLPDRNATIDPEAVEFANALAEHGADDRARAALAGGEPRSAETEPVVIVERAAPAGVLAGELGAKQRGLSRHEIAGGYRGVTWNKKAKRWQVSIGGGEKKADGRRRQLHLGFFDDPVVAALTYDIAAKKAFGPSARLNFPQGNPPPKKTRPPVGYVARRRTSLGGGDR
jgi:integrase